MLPHGFISWRHRMREERARKTAMAERAAFHSERRERISEIEGSAANKSALDGADYTAVIQYLVGRGLPKAHLIEGSVPQSSLTFVRNNVIDKLPTDRPLRALHIGNFVGVSLAFLTTAIVRRNPQSIVVSVDPNVAHRGIVNPQSHVLALLSKCGLQSNSLVLAGYSGNKSISNDGVVFGTYDPAKEFLSEAAAEECLKNLAQLCPASFDVIFLDGNHEADYLLSEIKSILPLLRPRGYVVLDDVDSYWAEIRDVFERITDFGLEPLEANGRVGIAQKRIA